MKPETLLAWVAALFLAACLFSHTVALRLLLVAAGIVLASIAIARDRHGIRALPPIWLPFLLWGLWAAASIAWSVEPDRSEKEWRNEVFYTAAALWVCYVGAQVRNARQVFAGILAAAALAACLIGLWEYTRGPGRYPVGLHGGSGNHSSALIILMPCVLMIAWYAARNGRAAWLVACALALGAVFFAAAYTTLNRTVWIAFAVQFVLLGALLLRRMPHRSRLMRPIAWSLAVLSACAIMVASIQVERQGIGNVNTFEGDSRLALWPEVLEHIGERPFGGYGFGRGVLRGPLQEKFGEIDKYLWHAHNLFLEALIQTGIPGLLLLVGLLGATVLAGWRNTRDPDDWIAACGMALLAVLVGTVVRNMTDTLLVRQNALLYWGMAGALLGFARRGRAPADDPKARSG